MEHRYRESSWGRRVTMLAATSVRNARGYWPGQVACPRALAVTLLLIFGIAANQPSWPQSDENAENRTSDEEYPIQLNDVTFTNMIKWAAQAYVAPERLEEIIPLFVYQAEDMLAALGDEEGNLELYLGVAIQHPSDDEYPRSVWMARPIDEDESTELFLSTRSSTERIVASRQLEDVEPEETLWVSESVWNRYLNRPPL